jgi:transcriptional regulator with XRE-family HTH domain
MGGKQEVVNPFGDFLVKRRAAVGMTQKELAERLTKEMRQYAKANKLPESYQGKSWADSTIAHWESQKNPSSPQDLGDIHFARVLARILEVEVNDVYRAAGMLEGAEIPINPGIMDIVRMLNNVSPADQEVVRQMLMALTRND